MPYVQQQLAGRDGPAVAATDYIRAFPDAIRQFVDRPYTVLGTDGYGRSDYRVRLRRFFEVDRHHVAVAALAAAMLALSGASFGLWSVVATTLRQELAPDELLGRTSSVYLVLGLGGIAVGGVVGGFVADGLGIRAPFLLGAPLLALTGLWLARELGRPADPTGRRPGHSR